MKATKFFLCLLLALSPLAAPAAFTISVSPSSIAWDSNTWVSVRITNDAISGYAANLTFFVDPDGDGAVGPEDVPLMNFMLRDGQTNGFGAVTIPDDNDGITNGAILTRIPIFGIDSLLHMVGSYVVQVAFTNGTSPAVTSFTVTQPTTTVYITGTVVNDTNTSMPVAAAYVNVSPFTRTAGFLPSVWTDTNGAFRIYLPPDMTGNVDGVMAGAFGYFHVPRRDDIDKWLSGYRFENDLQIGENALTNTLKVVPGIPGFLHTVSGQVVDDSGNPIPYALVGFEMQSENGGGDAGADDVTDIDGFFEMPIPHEMTGGFGADGGMMNLRGFVASGVGPITVTQDLSGLVITCPSATILARNRVIDSTSGDGVEGIGMSFDSDWYWSAAISVTGGLYEIGLVSNTYATDVNDDSYQPMGYSDVTGYEDLGVTNSGIYTNAPLYLTRGYVLSGTVFDRNTNALTDGEVGEFTYPSYNGWWDQGAQVNRHGQFVLLVATGQYGVGADRFAGYMSQNYSNHFFWEWNEGVVADPVTVTTNGATNINFFLIQASYIRGTVSAGGGPVTNSEVIAYTSGHDWRNSARTDTNGFYELGVLEGSGYVVEARGPDGSSWLNQYYDHQSDFDSADPVDTFTNAPAEDVDFDLPAGARIEGTFYQPDGVTPFTQTWGYVEAGPPSGGWVANSDINQDDGTYGFAVAPGVYYVRSEADGWLDQYYDGFYEYQRDQASIVTVEAGEVTGGIDFTMKQPSYVEGRIVSGGSAVTGVNTFVQYVADTGNWNTIFINATDSDSNGDYSIEIPPGSNFVVGVSLPDGSYFVQQYWSNVIQQQQSTLFEVETNSTVSDINFDLLVGMRIEGQVRNELGVPMESAWIDGSRFDTNGGWIWCGGDETDGEGNYGFAVPAGTSYFVRASRPWSVSDEDWWYPETFYSNKFCDSSADQLEAGPGVTVSDVDFHLAPGYRVEGFVYDSDGASPAPNGFVESLDAATNRYGNTSCQGNGYYRLCLPNHLPLVLFGNAEDRVPEYYDNVYGTEQATAIQPAAMTTTRVDFALYTWAEDHDSDGLPDYQEDTRPDGIYNPNEDWCSYTNEDTDSDHINDKHETDWDISPKLADTDGDTFTDWQEVYVTGTDPRALPSGSNSYLHCLQTTRTGSNVVLNWSSINYEGNYYVQRSTNLMNEAFWTNIFGPITATDDVMTVTDSNAPPNSAYRIRIPYSPP